MLTNSTQLLILISTIIPVVLLTVSITINKKKKKINNKSSPFECGFNPMNQLRPNFSIQFFLIMILFLIFDIEIILILPLPITTLKNTLIFISTFTTILILSSGLILEWKNGSLEWI